MSNRDWIWLFCCATLMALLAYCTYENKRLADANQSLQADNHCLELSNSALRDRNEKLGKTIREHEQPFKIWWAEPKDPNG
jgi:hypothetical protein